MSDLSEFLLARIVEDEAVARRSIAEEEAMAAEAGPIEDPRPAYLTEQASVGSEYVVGYRPARVLAECEAKRRIMDAAWADHLQIEGEWGHARGRKELSAANDYPEVVQWLALPYVDHPDYDPAWRA